MINIELWRKINFQRARVLKIDSWRFLSSPFDGDASHVGLWRQRVPWDNQRGNEGCSLSSSWTGILVGCPPLLNVRETRRKSTGGSTVPTCQSKTSKLHAQRRRTAMDAASRLILLISSAAASFHGSTRLGFFPLVLVAFTFSFLEHESSNLLQSVFPSHFVVYRVSDELGSVPSSSWHWYKS